MIQSQTRSSIQIENCFDNESHTQSELRDYVSLEHKHTTAKRRVEPSFRYNCHGLTFLSRRAWIIKDDVIDMILKEDGYKQIHEQNVLPGDIILYKDLLSEEIVHTGIIANSFSEGFNGIFAYSKWGRGREYLHSIYDCPYYLYNLENNTQSTKLEYWRMQNV